MIARRLLFGAFLVLGLGACNDDAASGGGPACVNNVDCELPLQCIEGRCARECRASLDCQAGQVCHESVCRSRPPACAVADDCAPFGEVCDRVRNVCVPPGTQRCDDALAPCAAGERCVDGVCRLPTNDSGRPRPDQGLPIDQGVDDPDMQVRPDQGVDDPDMAQPPVDQGVDDPDQGMACPSRAGAYGDRCLNGGDCQSGFCVENKRRGFRVCTTLCDLDAPNPANTCPGLDVCVAAEAQGGGTPGCPEPPDAPAPGEIVGVCIGNETGLPCSFDNPQPGDCLGGTCLRPPNPLPWINVQDVCAASCTDDRKCPPGTACRDVPPAGRICAPAVTGLSQCDQPEQCAGLCPAGLGEGCLQPDNRGAGYCVCLCRNAGDCPSGHACQPDPSGQKICIPFAGYRCPDEIPNPRACQGDAQCGAGEACVSGLCQYLQCPSLSCIVDDEDPRANQCTAGCVNAQDCPADYECRQFPGVGGFCVPFE